jgi:hypothetical protein
VRQVLSQISFVKRICLVAVATALCALVWTTPLSAGCGCQGGGDYMCPEPASPPGNCRPLGAYTCMSGAMLQCALPNGSFCAGWYWVGYC